MPTALYNNNIIQINFQQQISKNFRYNTGEVSWWMKVTEDMDLTLKEMNEKYGGKLFDCTY